VTTAAVELRGVRKSFQSSGGEVAAVGDVNLSIAPGEFFTLLGPSGCGKTTTLRLIAGFETPSAGDIVILGEPMTDVPPHRRPVNTVFQSYALFPHLSVGDNVGFGLAVKRVPKAERARRVAEALALVRMEQYAARRPSELSGGQQQRVALARALINRPGVLLLDEPLGALDLKLRKEMQIELKHMQRRLGITFVFVTHDQEEALTMSDRIAVMHKGKVLQVDTPVGIYERPSTRFGADFIGEMNFLQGRVLAAGTGVVEIEVGGGRCSLRRDHGADAGARRTLAVRPEALRMGCPGHAGQGLSLTGRVSDVIYIGTDRRVVLSLATGESVIVRAQNSLENVALAVAVGDERTAWCREADLHIFTD